MHVLRGLSQVWELTISPTPPPQACAPLWSRACGSSVFSSGICARVDASFRPQGSLAPTAQREPMQGPEDSVPRWGCGVGETEDLARVCMAVLSIPNSACSSLLFANIRIQTPYQSVKTPRSGLTSLENAAYPPHVLCLSHRVDTIVPLSAVYFGPVFPFVYSVLCPSAFSQNLPCLIFVGLMHAK